MEREQREHVDSRVDLRDAVVRELAREDSVSAEALESVALRSAADDNGTCAGGLARAQERVETLVRNEPRYGDDRDLVRPKPQRRPKIEPAREQAVDERRVLADVDRVREHAHALRISAERDDGVTGAGADDEHRSGATHDRRHRRRLDAAAPARLGPGVVALDEQHVRNVPRPAPGERALRCERAPAGDDGDIGSGVAERAKDARRQRVIVTKDVARAGNGDAAEEHRFVAEVDRPLP